MRAIGMCGYIDKYDLIMAIAKTITIMGKSVLVVDATTDDKYKYIVPSITNNEEKYITQYGEVDFATGFKTYEELTEYMNANNLDIEKYSFVLFDIECAEKYSAFSSKKMDKLYMFIDSNLVSVGKNAEIVSQMRKQNGEEEVEITKVFYRAYMTRAATNYLEEKVSNYGVKWTEKTYDVTLDEQDTMINIDSEYSGLIDIRKHTKQYIMYLCEFVSKLLGDEDEKNILKEIKRRRN